VSGRGRNMKNGREEEVEEDVAEGEIQVTR